MIPDLTKKRMLKETMALSHAERMERFSSLMENSFRMMSEEGYYNFLKRNHHKRRMIFKNGKWQPFNNIRNS
jgi:hypothetical protein